MAFDELLLETSNFSDFEIFQQNAIKPKISKFLCFLKETAVTTTNSWYKNTIIGPLNHHLHVGV
jgi:hypothetical protein